MKQRVCQPGGLIVFHGSGTLDRLGCAPPHRRCARTRQSNRRPKGIDDAIWRRAKLRKYIEIHLAPGAVERGAKFLGGAIKGTIDFLIGR